MPVTVVHNDFFQISENLNSRAKAACLKTAIWIGSEAKNQMAQPKTGRSYVVSATGAAHQASAPGQAPAIDTGNLVNSIAAEATDNGAVVYATAEYAVYLEFGTARMAPRPFFTPAAFKAVEVIWKSMKGWING